MPLPLAISERLSRPAWLNPRAEYPAAALTSLSAVAVLFSIAVSQIFLGAAVLCLVLSRRRLEFPARLGIALLAFLAWTLLSFTLSPDPMSGLPQIKKLLVFFIPLLVYNAYRQRNQIWRTLQVVVVAGSVAALYGLGQFGWEYQRLRSEALPFYENYVARQITGFMSHWMTFSGQLMLVLLLLFAVLLFSRQASTTRWGWLCFAVMSAGLVAAFTRGVWLATGVGIVYLLARFRRRLLWLLPLGVLLFYMVSPGWLRERQLSIFNLETDSSNQARLVMLQTGLRMIAAHPWFGLGPEQVGAEFLRYKPPELPLPDAWYGHLHNTYMQIAAERGIPCLFLLLWFLGEMLRQAWLLARNSDDSRSKALGHAAFAMTLAVLVEGLFEYNLGDSEVLMLYLFLTSAVFAWERLHEPSDPPTGAAVAERHCL